VSLVRVRPAAPEDTEAWVEMRSLLWPHSPEDHPREIADYFRAPPERAACLIADHEEQGAIGFAEVGLRAYAEECLSSPVGYLEGIYVRAAHRRSGVGRALVDAGKAWARASGCTEMASDRALDDTVSGHFHAKVGFGEVHRIVCYRMTL
jgi:aminoglycoside 6'-N-acetyltransferase I